MFKVKWVLTAVFAILFVAATSIGSVGKAEKNYVIHKDAEENTYKAIKIPTPDVEPISMQSLERDLVKKVGEKEVAKIKQNMELTEHREATKEWLIKNNVKHAGSYVKEDGTTVVQLTEKDPQLEKKLKAAVPRPDKLEIEYVKYSKEQLEAERKKLSEKKDEFGIIGLGMNDEKNKFNIYMSQENYDKYREEILSLVNEDMVNWVVHENLTIAYTAKVNPGDEMHNFEK